MPKNDILKYAGMATQFLATLGVAFFIGFKIDKYLGWKFPFFALVLSLAMLTVSFWKIYKDTTKKNEK